MKRIIVAVILALFLLIALEHSCARLLLHPRHLEQHEGGR
jgi:hypothetical protein